MPHVFEFGHFKIDAIEEVLTRGGERLSVNHRAFQVLLLLVTKAGRVVSKQEFFDIIWADTFVEDNSLTVAVTTLRKALGDDAKDPKYIENLPRKGYRFIAEVVAVGDEKVHPVITKTKNGKTEVENSAASGLLRHASLRSKVLLVAATILLLGFLAFVVGFDYFERRSASSTSGVAFESIAVVPFKTRDTDSEIIADGLSEGVARSLAEIPNLRVISRNSTFHYKNRNIDAATIGRELGVGTVLTGQIEIRGDLAIISVELSNVAAGRLVWSKEYERAKDDPLSIRDVIARDVSHAARPALPASPSNAPRGGTSNAEAYLLYITARRHLSKRTDIDNKAAVNFFQQALDKDPKFALAWIGLATCFSRYQWVPDKSGQEKNAIVVSTAQKALEIDKELGEAYAVIALSQSWFIWDMRSAAENYRRAVELSPNDSTARHWYAEFLAMQGRFEESFREYDMALTLDPLSFPILTDRALAYIYARQYDRALDELKRIERLNPDYQRTYFNLAAAYQYKGMFAEALLALNRFYTLQHENGQVSSEKLAEYKLLSKKSSDALGKSGRVGYWRTRLEYELYDKGQGGTLVSPIGMARVYAEMDDREKAFEYLNRAVNLGETAIFWLKVGPEWDNIRPDPRFVALTERIGFHYDR